MAISTTWNKQTIKPSSSWSKDLNAINHPDTGTSWSPQVIAPTTSWSEVLEEFKFWNDGNAFWQDVNAKYEDL